MEISVKKLEGHGFRVEAFDQDGHTLRALSTVTITPIPGCGGMPKGLLDQIRSLLMNREYGDLAVEALVRRVHSLQILESIEAADQVEE
jgi:hypothetical protein